MSLTELSVSFRGIGLRVDQLPQGHPIWERYDDYLGCDNCEHEYGRHIVGSNVIWCPSEEGENFTVFSPFCSDCNQPKSEHDSGRCPVDPRNEMPR